LYDPNGEYLNPPLQGYRLESEGYVQLEADASGALESRELGLLLRLEGDDLVMFDSQTGERQQSEAEAERAGRIAAEAELRRLRERLDAEGGGE
jgi:hypothetical protein